MTPADLLVLSISVGIVVSFVFSEAYGLAAGGVVVPGYIALYLDRPLALGMTLATALVAFSLTKVLSNFLIIYGRRRTALMILFGFALGAWLSRVEFSQFLFGIEGTETQVIGYIIPGLVAIWFDRQGIVPTLASLTIASVVVRLVILLIVGPLAFQGALG